METESITQDLLIDVKRGIKFFFEEQSYSSIYERIRVPVRDLGIFDIKLLSIKPVVKVEIHLDRPELLVGFGGLRLTMLENFLSNRLEVPVTIDIKEVTFWP